jgi:hypothetical protein
MKCNPSMFLAIQQGVCVLPYLDDSLPACFRKYFLKYVSIYSLTKKKLGIILHKNYYSYNHNKWWHGGAIAALPHTSSWRDT